MTTVEVKYVKIILIMKIIMKQTVKLKQIILIKMRKKKPHLGKII